MSTESGVTAEDLKSAERDLREAVAQHGAVHPIVLEQVNAFIELAKRAGNGALAAKLEEKAAIVRNALRANVSSKEPEPSAPAVTAPVNSAPPAASESASPVLVSADLSAGSEPAESNVPQESTSGRSFEEKHLYNSRGEHLAVVFDGDIYSPFGKYLGRWEQDLEAFIDIKGNYLGQMVEDNRLACDQNWRYRYLNFGTKSNGGNRVGWSKQPDTDRIALPTGFNDVSFAEESDE